MEKENNRKLHNSNYYQKHKDVLLERIKDKVDCELCNKSITKVNLNRHQKSSNCINPNNFKTTRKCKLNELQNKISELENKLNSVILKEN